MGIKYKNEFKQDAVKLAEKLGVKSASERLSVPIKALYSWRKKAKNPTATPLKGLLPSETAEEGFVHISKEVEELRDATEVLKKALGFMRGRQKMQFVMRKKP